MLKTCNVSNEEMQEESEKTASYLLKKIKVTAKRLKAERNNTVTNKRYIKNSVVALQCFCRKESEMGRLAVFGLMQSHQPVAPASLFAAQICAANNVMSGKRKQMHFLNKNILFKATFKQVI